MACKTHSVIASILIASFFAISTFAQTATSAGMRLNEPEYLEYQGVNVMLAHDFYPESHQGGVGIIRPDFPELLTWPFLWQQTEYVLGGGTTDYLFLVLAAEKLLNKK